MRAALIAALLGLLITGCGAPGGDRPDDDATLLLDSAPAAVHAGIFLATERDFDEAEGVRLEVRRPRASTDAAARLQDERADFAILDLGQLARARERGRDVVGVYAVVQRALPGDDGPLVLAATRTTVDERGPLVRATIRALQRGYAQAQAEPDSAVAAMLAQGRGDREALAADLDAVAPAFTAGARAPGELRRDALRRFAAGLDAPLDVSRAFDFDQVGPVRNP